MIDMKKQRLKKIKEDLEEISNHNKNIFVIDLEKLPDTVIMTLEKEVLYLVVTLDKIESLLQNIYELEHNERQGI